MAALPVRAAVYELKASAAEQSVTVQLTLPESTATEFRMPAWSPGDYRIVNFGGRLKNVRFSLDGKYVDGAKMSADANVWFVTTGADTVTYTVPAGDPGIFSENLRVTEQEVFVHGPAVFGYFVGHALEAHELGVALHPDPRATIECSLDQTSEGPGRIVLTAPDYDTLIDAPFAMGSNLKVKEFLAHGKPHRVVAFGRAGNVDLDGLADVGAKIASQCYALFGEIPTKRYIYLYDFGGPGGGLEHADSARMAMWPGLTPRNASSYIAHEYFHLYNVKRIRAKPLGPFDYTKPAITGSLWWLEGVTDYYAEVLTHRAGLQSRDTLLDTLSDEMRSFRRDPARLKTSADESSRRVWEADNSAGFGIGYYQKGKLIGWCLDLAVRAESLNKRSLDDVMTTLYNECKGGKPGFSEGRIRELAVQFGSEAVGPIYDRCVLQAVELPIEELLAKVGLQWKDGKVTVNAQASETARAIGLNWPMLVKRN